MSSELPPWAQYTPVEVPTIFNAARTAQNVGFLLATLGPKFLAGAKQAPRYIKHPILQRWVTNGANAFLELNALAEDIQCVFRSPGFEQVLRDLKERQTCMPTWHAVHSAALLARNPSSTVDRFFPQTDATLPDFLLRSPDGIVACEAKHLAVSGQEETFAALASELSSQVRARLMGGDVSYPTVTIVIKSVEIFPDIDFLLRTISMGLEECKTTPLAFKHPQVNIFFEPPDAPRDACQKAVYVLGRKSDKEDLRVQKRGQQASSQLAVRETRDYPGLLILSVGHIQDPEFIEMLFRRRFERGEYSGISAVMLIRSGTYQSLPQAAPADLISIVRNPLTTRPLPNLRIDPVGLIGRLRNEDQTPQVPAYRHQSKEMRFVAGTGNQGICIPDLRHLTPEMLVD
jgi:hypothetical protein